MGVDLLYWNIDSRGLPAIKPGVVDHIADEPPGILILSEPPEATPPPLLATALSAATGLDWALVATLNPTRTAVFVQADGQLTVHGFRGAHDGRVGFYKVGEGALEVLLVALHLKDARNNSSSSRHSLARRVAQTIREVESDFGHDRTVVVGDFNMNPYDVGMTAADGFNAVADLRVARGDSRTLDGARYPFFYNPCWSMLGDDPGPPGSFYWGSNDGMYAYWHVIDQVLARASLLRTYRLDATIEALEAIMTPAGRPSRSVASDHFPLRVRLEVRT